MYTPSQILWQQFSDYEWMINMKDLLIPEDRYIYKNPNGKQNQARFLVYEAVDWIDMDALKQSIDLVKSYNALVEMDVETAINWIKQRTNLEEVEIGKFLISEETTDIMTNEIIPAQYLNLNLY